MHSTKLSSVNSSNSQSFAKLLRDARDAIASFRKGYQESEKDERKGLLGEEEDLTDIFFRITHLSKETLHHANSIAENLKEDTEVFESNVCRVT